MNVAPASAVIRDADHRYFDPVSRRPLIGVSRVLTTAGLIEPRWFTESGQIRGTSVHQALEIMDAGTDDPVAVRPEHHGYLYAYQKFLRECDLGPVILNEKALKDLLLGYAGTIDRVRLVCGKLAVIDIKTGAAQPWHRVQLAAYAALAKQAADAPHAIVTRWGLYLRADGQYTFTQYADRSDWDVFKAALVVAQFQRRHGR